MHYPSTQDKNILQFNNLLSDCYNGVHKGTGGKIIQFFSLLSLTSIDKDYVRNRWDTGTVGAVMLTAGKYLLRKASAAVNDAIEAGGAVVLLTATSFDEGAYGTCALLGAGITLGPKTW
jgi:hypothetical protein